MIRELKKGKILDDADITTIFSNINVIRGVNSSLLAVSGDLAELVLTHPGYDQTLQRRRCWFEDRGSVSWCYWLHEGAAVLMSCSKGKLFVLLSQMYSIFCNNQSRATAHVHSKISEELFKAYLLERFPGLCPYRIWFHNICADLGEESLIYPVRSYLVKPMQRICKYPLLLRVCQRHLVRW